MEMYGVKWECIRIKLNLANSNRISTNILEEIRNTLFFYDFLVDNIYDIEPEYVIAFLLIPRLLFIYPGIYTIALNICTLRIKYIYRYI